MRAWILGLLVSLSAFAQAPDEYALPDFAPAAAPVPDVADAGVPSEPPLPVLPAVPEVPANPPVPRWASVGGSLGLLFTGLTQAFLGLDAALLGTIHGTPLPAGDVPGAAEGWLLQGGVQGGWGRVGSPLCRGTAFCGTRVYGGLSVRGGWGRGAVSLKDGVTRAQTLYFAQVDLDAAHFSIESAPLAPGRDTWELLTRLRVGLQWTAAAARATTTGVALLGAVVFEAVPVSDGTRTVSFGATVGIGF